MQFVSLSNIKITHAQLANFIPKRDPSLNPSPNSHVHIYK